MFKTKKTNAIIRLVALLSEKYVRMRGKYCVEGEKMWKGENPSQQIISVLLLLPPTFLPPPCLSLP
jgi:hypothetical protein